MLPLFMAIENEQDRSKMTQIYNEYYSRMISEAKRILRDHALAEDAVSDSLEKIIRNLHKIDKISCYQTRSLIVIIVRNTALNILKKQKRSDVVPDTDLIGVVDERPLPVETIVSMDGFRNIVEIIDSLPESLRDVAVLFFLHEFTHKEIQELLGISYEAVKMRLMRARKEIKQRLVGEEYGR